jgi:hypothetical protein
MQRQLRFTTRARDELAALAANPRAAGLLKQVRKTLGLLETDLHHPGLNTHRFISLHGANGEEVFEACAQNNTPDAYRIFWHYGPDEKAGKKRIPILTVLAITPHP